ncbi:MAG: PIN domain-containing protein [Chitinivibrionales bacterium]|nr:PIN domain-containing protein [Chitinivibrionales bacterium]
MEKRAYLDTHIIVWLYAAKLEYLTKLAKDTIDTCELYYSPIVDLELTYLFEIKRISARSEKILDGLNTSIGLKQCDLSFDLVILKSKEMKWTCDPFDRIIVGQAATGNNYLISKDTLINKHYKYACW